MCARRPARPGSRRPARPAAWARVLVVLQVVVVLAPKIGRAHV